jgi:hypothetical protein
MSSDGNYFFSIFLGYSIDMKSTCSKFERKWNDDPALNILLNDGRLPQHQGLAYLLLSLKMMNLPQDGIFPHDNKL